ncbi:MAG: hypothetical protein RJB38_1202 [Pseudomonadota bacterium]
MEKLNLSDNLTTPTASQAEGVRARVRESLELGVLLAEKCALAEAKKIFSEAFKSAKAIGHVRLTVECLARLLRMASEARDQGAISRGERELKALMASFPDQIPPMVWYCQAVLAGQKEQWRAAQSHLRQYLRALDQEPPPVSSQTRESQARAWVMIANTSAQRGQRVRAEKLLHGLLARFESERLPAINGLLYLQLGWMRLRARDADGAQTWIDRAHAAFLGEHHWYHHLYVLYAYACLERVRGDYSKARWYLELLERATTAPELGFFRKQIDSERERLEHESVDLLVDGRKLEVKTRESPGISLGKQYVLLHILEALSEAHQAPSDHERGLSKAELIEKVWGERYQPLAHDNKLYYNINRLRRLIEPDMKQPQYLQNWKEGYRLAPGLKIQMVGANNPLKKKRDQKKGEER